MFSITDRRRQSASHETGIETPPAETQLTIHQPTVASLIEGFVDVRMDNRGKNFNFVGLLAPCMDRNNEARNRFLLLDRRAPEWFHELCEEIVQRNKDLETYGLDEDRLAYEPMQVRMRVVSMPAGESASVAFLLPRARDKDHAIVEWGREKERLQNLPTSLQECKNDNEVAYFVFGVVARRLGVRIVKYNFMEDYAIGVSSMGILVKMTGGRQVATMRAGIESAYTTLDKEISTWVKHCRVMDRRGLGML